MQPCCRYADSERSRCRSPSFSGRSRSDALPEPARRLLPRGSKRAGFHRSADSGRPFRPGRDTRSMRTIAHTISDHGMFLRRRDLLALGFNDDAITSALESGSVFRVRQGWYSLPDAPQAAVEAVRVGGRLTGRSALESYGVPVPRSKLVQIAVARNACRLRSPTDRRSRLSAPDRRDVRWVETGSAKFVGSRWRVSVTDALSEVIRIESRDITVACCDLVINGGWLTAREVDALFAEASNGRASWGGLVDGRSEAHGETFVRLWLEDAGIPFQPQTTIAGVGRLDGRVSSGVCIEVDGTQHASADPPARAGRLSPFEDDHRRDIAIVFTDQRSLRFTYRQLYLQWDRCLAAVRHLLAEEERIAALERDSVRLRKRRTSDRARQSVRRHPP